MADPGSLVLAGTRGTEPFEEILVAATGTAVQTKRDASRDTVVGCRQQAPTLAAG
ncbi:MAG: hypothetical protein ACXVHQ_36620 [Solirubrobacteraceae bacterium]